MTIEELKALVRARVLAVTNAKSETDLPVGLTTAQAAKVLGRSSKTLHNWSSDAEGPVRPVKDAQGRLHWPVDRVELFLVREGV